jgi:predicted phosphate transport protein (TIGR00153 family)
VRFTPRDTSFYDLFTEAANNICDAATLLTQLFAAAPAERPDIAARIRELEHASDDVAHKTLRQLNSTFVTPFDRADIYELTSKLDDVMDFIEAASDLVVLYEVGELPGEMAAIADVLLRASRTTADAMPRLRTMESLDDYWIEANRLENEADKLHRRFVAKLFSGDYDALTVMKLKEIVEQLEEAADAFEHVANTVETIAVKES